MICLVKLFSCGCVQLLKFIKVLLYVKLYFGWCNTIQYSAIQCNAIQYTLQHNTLDVRSNVIRSHRQSNCNDIWRKQMRPVFPINLQQPGDSTDAQTTLSKALRLMHHASCNVAFSLPFFRLFPSFFASYNVIACVFLSDFEISRTPFDGYTM
jgi:hypothetical protein